MKPKISEFQKRCYKEYLVKLQKMGLIPEPYLFPYGNPVRTVIPTTTETNGIMIIGAFPSARFENVNGYLIPCANNLSPFGEEEYFDGKRVRVQESRKSLNENYFSKLKINPAKIWLTDIVKIYLYPEKHIKNCKKVNPDIIYVNTHKHFKKIAKESLQWLIEEITICSPKLIITLGEVAARVLTEDNKSKNKELLDGSVQLKPINGAEYYISHLAHPEIYRINNEWKIHTEKALNKLGRYIVANKLTH